MQRAHAKGCAQCELNSKPITKGKAHEGFALMRKLCQGNEARPSEEPASRAVSHEQSDGRVHRDGAKTQSTVGSLADWNSVKGGEYPDAERLRHSGWRGQSTATALDTNPQVQLKQGEALTVRHGEMWYNATRRWLCDYSTRRNARHAGR